MWNLIPLFPQEVKNLLVCIAMYVMWYTSIIDVNKVLILIIKNGELILYINVSVATILLQPRYGKA